MSSWLGTGSITRRSIATSATCACSRSRRNLTHCRSYTTLNFSLTPAADPASVNVFPSPDAVKVDLYISLPSFFHVSDNPRAPLFAATHVQPAGHIGPVAG